MYKVSHVAKLLLKELQFRETLDQLFMEVTATGHFLDEGVDDLDNISHSSEMRVKKRSIEGV